MAAVGADAHSSRWALDDAICGRWRKETVEPFAARYPAEVQFAEATYLAAKGPEQRFISWDAGIHRVGSEGGVLVSTATDELVPYQIEHEGQRITLTDPGGDRFSYRRVSG